MVYNSSKTKYIGINFDNRGASPLWGNLKLSLKDFKYHLDKNGVIIYDACR